jgi:hypothetical protein
VKRVALALFAPPAPGSAGTVIRCGLAALVFLYALALAVLTAVHGDFFSPAALLIMAIAVAVYREWGGRAVRDWGLVFVAFISYAVAADAVPDLGFKVHYTPQIEAERLLHGGTLPTIWLQEHLYAGRAGVLEIFSLVMYLSHFLAPVLLASLIWLYWPGRAFGDLFLGILAVTLLGEITFLLAPTAPPWLAGDEGVIPHVHHVIKESLYDLGLDGIAVRKDNPGSYNLVAALPSLHAAWPVIGLLVIRKHRLPRWLLGAQAALTLGVVFAIVYTGEHYFVDALLGVVYALGAWWLLQRALRRDSHPT